MSNQEEFVRIDVAKTSFEARIVVSVLQAAGITAYVDGANLMDEFAISQALMNNVGVQITVPAGQVAAAYAALDAARATPLEETAVGPEPEPSLAAERVTNRVGLSPLAVVALVAAIVFFALWQTAIAEAAALSGGSDLFVHESWDRGVRSYWKDTKNLYAETIDADQNGDPEVVTRFNRDGVRLAVSYDADQDGVFEECVQFYPDGSKSRWHDKDQDGIYESREVFDEKGALLFTEEDRGRGGFVRR